MNHDHKPVPLLFGECHHPDPQLCARLGFHLPPSLHRIYQTRGEYRALWESQAAGRRPQVQTFGLCAHLGEQTGEVFQCQTCPGNTRIKLFGCQQHGTCSIHKPFQGTACCTTCPDYRAPTLGRMVRRYHREDLGGGIPGDRFNASIAAYQDHYVMAFRNLFAGSNVFLTHLDRSFQPVGEAQWLDLMHQNANGGREDPRLFWFAGRWHVAFIGVQCGPDRSVHTNQMYARLGDDFRVEQVFAPRYAARQPWEKNWQFFDHEGDLLAVYSINPHRVVRVQVEDVALAHETDWSNRWLGGDPRGGAPPVLIGDEYWHFFHARANRQQVPAYHMGLYTFDAAPPFCVKRIVPQPILVADVATKPKDQYAAVVFPCGAVRDQDRWLVSMGVHDRWIELWEFAHQDLERKLIPV